MAQTHTRTNTWAQTHPFHPTLSCRLCVYNTGWRLWWWWWWWGEYCRFLSTFTVRQTAPVPMHTPSLYLTYKQGLWQCALRIWLSPASFPIGFPYRSQFGVVNICTWWTYINERWMVQRVQTTNALTHTHVDSHVRYQAIALYISKTRHMDKWMPVYFPACAFGLYGKSGTNGIYALDSSGYTEQLKHQSQSRIQ